LAFFNFSLGTSRGIGLGLVREFLKHSQFRVVATCRQPNEATELQTLQKNATEDRLLILPLEVNSTESHDNLKAQLSAQGITSIDILIANAGVLSMGQQASTATVEAMRNDFETNVIGTMLTLQAYMDLVLASRLKIFSVMSSIMGSIDMAVTGDGSTATYRVSKAALNMYAVNFAAEARMKDAGCKMLMIHPVKQYSFLFLWCILFFVYLNLLFY
jgi:NAD(P)-dependent dehydrogenase (short-subunit alcohol dehydrogenase family)